VTFGDAVLTFVSVLLAALLAFYLDGLRERRAARRWVSEYLGFWRDTLEQTASERDGNDAILDRIDRALDRWLHPRDGVSEPEWADIDTVNVNTAVAFTPLLLSTGAKSVPIELLRQMFLADATVPALAKRSEIVASVFYERILPLRLDRVAQLTPEQRNTVEFFRLEFAGMREQMRVYLGMLDGIREELVRLGY
jgi:hypothetical protein